MRIGSIHLVLFLIMLALPAWAPAQQAAPAGSEKAEGKGDATAPPAKVKENWGALDDLKTGLQPIAYVELQKDEQPGYVRQLIRVQWRPNDPIDLWVIRPKVTGKVPLVLYLYTYTDLDDRFHDNGWCERAAANGFAAIGFIPAITDYRYRARPMKEWFVSELAESLGSTVHDVQLILNYVADRGDMDMGHVGMFGMGSGATIAILAAHADSRIKTLDLLDPWGDWPDWLRESPVVPDAERSKYLTPEFLKSVATLDPVAYLPSLKTQNLRLQQTLTEPVTPQPAKDRIAAAVRNPTEVVRYGNATDLLKEWQTMGLSGWIKQAMRLRIPGASRDDGRVAESGKGLTPMDVSGRGDTTQHENEK
jgi:hypothetical protein